MTTERTYIDDGYHVKVAVDGRRSFYEGRPEPRQFFAQYEVQAINKAAKKRGIGIGFYTFNEEDIESTPPRSGQRRTRKGHPSSKNKE